MSSPNTHYGADGIRRMLDGVTSVYFLGIGGISMSSLAELTHRRGLRVGGYDRTRSALTAALEARGIEAFDTPDPAHLDGYGAVVYTVAIAEDHPEYMEARRRGLPLIARSDYMGYLMLDYTNRIGFAGSHGKSTATCMCAQIFMSAAADPTVLSGAAMKSMGGAFRSGGRENMVFEACEYKDSFLDFYPTVAVVLNAELDHVDYFHDMAQLRTSFSAFAGRVGEQGLVIYNADDAETRTVMETVSARAWGFSCRSADAYIRATDIRLVNGYPMFDLRFGERCCGKVQLGVPGEHNVYNALAAAGAAHACGVCDGDIVRGLEAFGGAVRRMEFKGYMNGARVYDDYAHHPTEVEATLRQARALGQGRLICAFQPHTYSRTAALWERYLEVLRLADDMIVAPIYAAREVDTPGVSAQVLADAVGGSACGAETMQEVQERLVSLAAPGDTVIVMGAGNIERLFDTLPLEQK